MLRPSERALPAAADAHDRASGADRRGAAARCRSPRPIGGSRPIATIRPARILALLAVCVGLALFRPLFDRPVGPGLVQPDAAGQVALSALFAVESRLAVGAVELSVRRRAAVGWSCAKLVVDRRLRAVLRPVRHAPAGKRPGCGVATARPPIARPTQLGRDEPAPSWLRRLLWLAVAGLCLDAAVGHDESSLPGHALGPLSVGGAAELVSVVVHHRLRSRALVPAAALRSGGPGGDLSDGRHVQPAAWGDGWLGQCTIGFWDDDADGRGSRRSATRADLVWQLAGLFALCMLCHGELVRLRPAPRYLTSFYLMISAGGAWAACRSASWRRWSSTPMPNGRSAWSPVSCWRRSWPLC